MQIDRVLITGGAGFIGSHLARDWLARGAQVTVFDNLSRLGAAQNLRELRQFAPDGRLRVVVADVRNFEAVRAVAAEADLILHLAAQVAVTTSLVDPRSDFEVNALGTFNVLEAARRSGRDPIVVFSSTNKVYGGLEQLPIVELETRYAFADGSPGVSERCPLDFHSPYGCSKGTADQYVRDYARSFGLRTIVFRLSCIYGPQQYGNEDQGWVAHFVHAALRRQPITIYGDGKQVRDLLYVGDLVEAVGAAVSRIDVTAGRVFNLGGGMANAVSVWQEFQHVLHAVTGIRPTVAYGDWRTGDQKIYVTDTAEAERVFGWRPRTPVEAGLRQLAAWAEANADLVTATLRA